MAHKKKLSLAQTPPDRKTKWCVVSYASDAGITGPMLGECVGFVAVAWGRDFGQNTV